MNYFKFVVAKKLHIKNVSTNFFKKGPLQKNQRIILKSKLTIFTVKIVSKDMKVCQQAFCVQGDTIHNFVKIPKADDKDFFMLVKLNETILKQKVFIAYFLKLYPKQTIVFKNKFKYKIFEGNIQMKSLNREKVLTYKHKRFNISFKDLSKTKFHFSNFEFNFKIQSQLLSLCQSKSMNNLSASKINKFKIEKETDDFNHNYYKMNDQSKQSQTFQI